MRPNGDPLILIAEDVETDVAMLRLAFTQAGLYVPMHVVSTGEECVAYLKGNDKYANREEYPLPDLLLLDLKMPGFDGFEVLKWLRGQPDLASLRVVVLTNSECIRDVNQAYQLGANSFLTKPLNFTEFTHTIQAMYNFWLQHSQKPEVQRPPPLRNPLLDITPDERSPTP